MIPTWRDTKAVDSCVGLLRVEEANVAKRKPRLTGKILDSGAASENLELPVASSSTSHKIIERMSACQFLGWIISTFPI